MAPGPGTDRSLVAAMRQVSLTEMGGRHPCNCSSQHPVSVLLLSKLGLGPFCTFPQVAWQSGGLARRGT